MKDRGKHWKAAREWGIYPDKPDMSEKASMPRNMDDVMKYIKEALAQASREGYELGKKDIQTNALFDAEKNMQIKESYQEGYQKGVEDSVNAVRNMQNVGLSWNTKKDKQLFAVDQEEAENEILKLSKPKE